MGDALPCVVNDYGELIGIQAVFALHDKVGYRAAQGGLLQTLSPSANGCSARLA